MTQDWLKIQHAYPYLFLLLICLLNLWKSVSFPIHDFGNYYFGAKSIIHDFFDPAIYNADYFNELISKQWFDQSFFSYYPNPPSLSLFFIPLAYLDFAWAKFIFNCASIFALVASLRIMQREWDISNISIASLGIIFFFPIRNNILFGQVYFFILYFIIQGYLAFVKNKSSKHHYWWAIAGMLKISPVLLYAIPFLQRKMSFILYGFVWVLFISLISFIFIPIETWVYFINHVFFAASQGELYNGFAKGAESLHFFLKNVFVHDTILNPTPLLNSSLLFSIISKLIKSIVLVSASILTLRTKNQLFIFGLWVLVILILSPTLSSYSLILLVIPYLIQKQSKTNDLVKWFSLLMVFICCNYNQGFISNSGLFLSFCKMYALLIFWLTYIHKSILHLTTRDKLRGLFMMIVLTTIQFGISTLGENKVSRAEYVLSVEDHILMHDFQISNNSLEVIYWNRGVKSKIRYDLDVQFKKQIDITDSIENHFELVEIPHIKKAIKLDTNTIFYLTDRGRSPGFYTLKKIDI